jgi:hypothetical protein
VYTGAIPRSTDILTFEQASMVALAALAQATFGTTTVVSGLAVGPTTVASMSVNVGPGAITSLQPLEATAFGSLAADTTDTIVKVGVNSVGVTNLALTAPGTSGLSINYLIEATFLEVDTGSTVLPYYNAAAPATPYAGPANAGTSQNTLRTQRVSVQAKAGTAATTGTQVTPAVDAGYVPLAVVTVAFGATSIVAGNISVHPAAPLIDAVGTGRGIQPGRLLGTYTLTSSQTWFPPAGTNLIEVMGTGNGGGSGGCAANGSTGNSTAGGGQGGSECVAQFNTPSLWASGIVVSIGTPGAAGAAGANGGGNGATASFGSLISLPGGVGGSGGATVNISTTPVSVTNGGNGSSQPTITGASRIIKSTAGAPGGIGLLSSGTAIFGGQGGSSQFGNAANPGTSGTAAVTNAAVAGTQPGTGGTGGSANTSTGAIAGAAGAGAQFTVRCYA